EVIRRLPSAPFLTAARDIVVDEDAPHGLRGDRQVMRATLPRDPIELPQLQPRFVDQGRRAERVTRALIAELAGSHPPEFVINERKHLLHRGPREASEKR